jgi:GT2 family glycosyltransferase
MTSHRSSLEFQPHLPLGRRLAPSGTVAPGVQPQRRGQANVVVVLVTHDRPQLLMESLAALRAQSRRPRTVIVVDNASADETRSVLATADVEVVRSETNLGGAGGFALGMRRALERGADWLWLMDDDAIPQPGALEALQEHLQGLPDDAAVVCSCVMEFGAIATTHRREFDGLLGYERALPRSAYTAQALPVDTASFVGFMVSAAAVRCVGLPRPEFFLSYDDTEYSLRLGRQGYSLWLVPSSVILHKRHREGRLGACSFGEKHYYNVRNRIAVKRSYCRASLLGGVGGALFGMALWLYTPGRFARGRWRMLIGAIGDGFAGRLGPLPGHLRPGGGR